VVYEAMVGRLALACADASDRAAGDYNLPGDEHDVTNPYRTLPSIDALLLDDRLVALVERHGRDAVTQLAREALEDQRDEIRRTGEPLVTQTVELVLQRSGSLESTLLPVINATGVIIHTNLGRAPLARSALEAMRRVSEGYSTLEFDLEAGGRGSRHAHVERLLCRATGAEAAIAVNNNASALLLALAALCAGGEVVISRGQLVEIGGGFRIPDVMRQSGARLVEVGTTNRTYVRDYEAAIGDHTSGLLRVHSSNFAVVGFTAAASIGELSTLARRHELALIDDLGSGALVDTQQFGLAAEPMVQDSVTAGADVVLFSGDKLLGGPQAGIAVGRREAIESMKQHPLARAVRIDKASLAALGATIQHYLAGDALEELPVWRMIATPLDQISRRARRWSLVCGQHGETIEGRSAVGGGSLPGEELPTVVCAVTPPDGDADAFAAALRRQPTPIVGRIRDDRVLLDPRTVDPRDDHEVEQALASLCGVAGAVSPERPVDERSERPGGARNGWSGFPGR
jgi:L-seryl-tRNA(Ser) seleniumtransferase